MQHVEMLKFKQEPKWDCLSCQIGGHGFGVKPCQLKGLKIRLSHIHLFFAIFIFSARLPTHH